MENINYYRSFADYAVTYFPSSHTFSVKCLDKQNALNNVKIESIVIDGKKLGGAEIFKECVCENDGGMASREYALMTVKYKKGPDELKRLNVKFAIDDSGVQFSVNAPKNCTVTFKGNICWGDGTFYNTYPMSTSKKNTVVRSAIGPASSNKDNILFDRLSDNAVVLEGSKKLNIKYDWDNKTYTFKAETGAAAKQKCIHVYTKSDILANIYKINYTPLNRNRTFSTPPMGWMTWYATRFDACEEKVLKNALWQKENLKSYGANVVWVDWEWCHKDFAGVRADGCDTLNPDKEKYPNGLKYVSDKIKEMGFVPALWIGFTVESDLNNDYIKENPEVILKTEKAWCGSHFFDLSHPKFLNEFLPKAFAKVKEWGYNVIKFDTITNGKIINEKYHYLCYDQSLTSRDLQRNLAKVAREQMGEDAYMLSCCAHNTADVLWTADLYESTRVGSDIFNWQEFISNGVLKILRFYPLHNNVFFADCDNLVLREQYNDYNQAMSRVYFVSMLGLPMTFGDEFEALDEKRVELIKKSLPVLDVHPMDINYKTKLLDVLKMNLAIEKDYESYNVVNVFNIGGKKNTFAVSFEDDLNIDDGKYLVYDFTKDVFCGLKTDSFEVELDVNESRIFAVRKLLDRPQLVSTSRHISQGAAEIDQMKWENNTLTLTANVIGSAEYTLTLYVPEGFAVCNDLVCIGDGIYKKTVVPETDKKETFTFKFDEKK